MFSSTRFYNTLFHAHSEITFNYILELEIGKTLLRRDGNVRFELWK